MQSLPESLKSFANQIARAAASDKAAQIARLLRVSGLLGSPAPETDQATNTVSVAGLDDVLGGAPARSYGENVGIWAPKNVSGKVSFVRRMETMTEWTYWADVGRIEPKNEKIRVLLIGESVARGYLYDPVFNPAIALQMILEEQFGEGQVEVIDLARTNLGFQILEVAINALQMEPDLAIVFAGNNWYISEPLPSGIAEIDDAIGKHGIAGAKRAIDAELGRTAKRVVNEICTAYEKKGVPLVWMIPEFNLRDWRDPLTNAPYLPDGLNKEWLQLMDEAECALRDRDLTRAEMLAKRMVEIDGGVCVAGLYILAECRRHANDIESERNYLSLARDATSWDLSRETVPRPYSAMQNAVREQTSKHNIQVIDLPAVFKEHLKGGIADRSLFLDYCHLTTEGIQVAMGAAAACVLRALKGVDRPWYAYLSEHVAPSPETEAEALLLAAITNAHCSQPRDLVEYFCTRALNFSPHVAEWMINYLELQTTRSAPPRMSKAEDQMWKSGSPLMRNLLRLNRKRLDRMLLKVCLDTLEQAGVDARKRVEQLCLDEHSVAHNPTDLLDYYYLSAADQPQEMVWLHRNERYRSTAEYYRAYWPESRFIFVGEAGSAVGLCLTCRLPKSTAPGQAVRLSLNGRQQLKIAVDSEWTTFDINLPGAAVHSGLNELVISWPMPEFESRTALEKARLKIIERKFPDFYPVFGEIHSFTALDGRKASTYSHAVQTESSLVEVA